MLVHYYNEGHQIKHDVEPSQSSPKVSLIEHLLLSQLGPPHEDEQSWLECETTDEVPEGRQTQVLHELSPEAELEVDGKEEEIPDQIHTDRGKR